MIDIERARVHYERIPREELINILINKMKELEELKNQDDIKLIKQLVKRIKKAIFYIDSYTDGRKYMTENDKQLLKILERGVL